MRHIISILMENEAGALSRVAGLFSARGYNIESLSVAPTEDPTLSRMTLVTSGTDAVIEQITKQLNKLLDVVKLMDMTEGAHIEREMMLVKVKSGSVEIDSADRPDGMHQRLLNEQDEIATIELIGTGSELDAFLKKIDASAVIEVVRSGVSAIAPGVRSLTL